MGTRGYYGFLYKGKLYVMYNHFDSYPERPGLGWTLVKEIWWGNLEHWKLALEKIRVVSSGDLITEDDEKALREYTDKTVDNPDVLSWYQLTRKCQGSALRVLQSGYFYGSCSTVPSDEPVSLGGVWGYLLDFDNNQFRIFIGGEERTDLGCPLDQVPDTMFDNDWIVAFNAKEKAKYEAQKPEAKREEAKAKPKEAAKKEEAKAEPKEVAKKEEDKEEPKEEESSAMKRKAES